MIRVYYLKTELLKEEIIEEFSKKEKYASITNSYKRVEKIGRDLLFDFVVKKENIDGEVVYNDHGKPDFKNSKYHFNISHSKGLVVMVFSDMNIGIDVQKIFTYEEDSLYKLTRRIYNDNDFNYYNTDDNVTFTQIWTIKEAYLKYVGLGLVNNFRDINIDFEDGKVSFSGNIAKFITGYSNDFIFSIVCKNVSKEQVNYLFKNKILYDDEKYFKKN